MPPPSRASAFASAPLADLFSILLRQLKRPLAAHGMMLNDSDANRMAAAIVSREAFAEAAALHSALSKLVDESLGVLGAMNLTFEQSLQTDMAALGGWETTAEFLERANEKANAELRITLGAALLLALGDRQYGRDLLHVAAGDFDDETAIAHRAFAFAAGIDPQDDDFLAQAERWLEG